MRQTLFRAMLVTAAFTLLAGLSIASLLLSDQGVALPPPVPANAFGMVFLKVFRYYLAWAVLAPGVFWLWRRVPITRTRWRGPLVFHTLVPIVGTFPVFVYHLLFNALLGRSLPSTEWVASQWQVIVIHQSTSVIPLYWLLLGIGAAHQSYRHFQARQLAAVELQRSLEQARLDALRMQLQPHFLFNTLNTISCLAQEGDTDLVMRVVERLGTLLRLSMETAGRPFVSLAEEVALLNAYLGIEAVRFSDRLRLTVSVDEDAGLKPVPNLILLPLVENALAHGVARCLGRGELEVTASLDGQRLLVTVQDNGPGLPPGWTLATGAGQGLRNVAERLEALYPGAWALEFLPGAHGGLAVRLRMPSAPAHTAGDLE
jgi:two-component system LytT family sensor kinase